MFRCSSVCVQGFGRFPIIPDGLEGEEIDWEERKFRRKKFRRIFGKTFATIIKNYLRLLFWNEDVQPLPDLCSRISWTRTSHCLESFTNCVPWVLPTLISARTPGLLCCMRIGSTPFRGSTFVWRADVHLSHYLNNSSFQLAHFSSGRPTTN